MATDAEVADDEYGEGLVAGCSTILDVRILGANARKGICERLSRCA